MELLTSDIWKESQHKNNFVLFLKGRNNIIARAIKHYNEQPNAPNAKESML